MKERHNEIRTWLAHRHSHPDHRAVVLRQSGGLRLLVRLGHDWSNRGLHRGGAPNPPPACGPQAPQPGRPVCRESRRRSRQEPQAKRARYLSGAFTSHPAGHVQADGAKQTDWSGRPAMRIPSIRHGVRKVLTTVQFNRDARIGGEQVDLQPTWPSNAIGSATVETKSPLSRWLHTRGSAGRTCAPAWGRSGPRSHISGLRVCCRAAGAGGRRIARSCRARRQAEPLENPSKFNRCKHLPDLVSWLLLAHLGRLAAAAGTISGTEPAPR